MRPVVISFYTDEFYRSACLDLVRSCRKHGYRVRVFRRPDKGGWALNCAQKPEVLRAARSWYRGPLLWLDADSEMQAPPPMPSGVDIDVACVQCWGRTLSGAIWIADTINASAFLDAWCLRQRGEPEREDDLHFQDALSMPGLRIGRLAPGCCYVFDLWPKVFPNETPFIVHKQASRCAKPGSRKPHEQLLSAWKRYVRIRN